MKIGFITDDYHPRVDGVVVYVDTMSRALRNLGHEVYIICPKYRGYSDNEDSIIREPSIDPLPLSKLKSNMMLSNKNSIENLADLDLDIIHVHTQAGANFTGYKLGKLKKLKTVTTMHTTYHPLTEIYPVTTAISGWLGNFLSWINYRDFSPFLYVLKHPIPTKKTVSKWINSYIKTVLDNSDRVLVNSEHTYEYVRSFGSDTPMTIVRNGIDTNLFKPSNLRDRGSSLPFKLVYASRLSGEKHQELTIEAVNILKNQGLEVELTIVGDGPYRRHCEKLVNKLSLEDQVDFTGEVDQNKVADILSQNDAGLLASHRFDTNPLSVMEYLASGLPVIYCDENFDDMFIENAAMRCDFSAEGFADAIEKIASHKSLSTMSEAALESAKKHDIKLRAKELIKVYEELRAKPD